MPAIPEGADRLFAASVRVNGEDQSSVYSCVENIAVEEDIDQGSSFQLTLNACREEDGSWPFLEDENLQIANEIEIIASFPDAEEIVMQGLITNLNVNTHPEAGRISVEIQGTDRSYLLDRCEKCRVWTEMTYEAIVEEILADYQQYDIEADVVSPPGGGTPSPVTQRGTDLRFIRELARRKGYEFWIEEGAAYFGPPRLDGTPQKLIAVNFGAQTNCEQIQLRSDGTRPTVAHSDGLDPETGRLADAPYEATLDDVPETRLGTTTLDDLWTRRNFPPTCVLARTAGHLTPGEAAEWLVGRLRREAWWVSFHGTLNGLRYGKVLRTKRLVTVKGLGTVYNGDFYVRKVRHQLGARSYTMEFDISRNATGQLGTEDFAGELAGAA